MELIDKIEKISSQIEKELVKEKLNMLTQIYMEKSAEADMAISNVINIDKLACEIIKSGGIDKEAFRPFSSWLANRRLNSVARILRQAPEITGSAARDVRFLDPKKISKLNKTLTKVEGNADFVRSNKVDVDTLRKAVNSSMQQYPSEFGFEGLKPMGQAVKGLFQGPMTPGKAAGMTAAGVVGANLLPKEMWSMGRGRRPGYIMTPQGAMLPAGGY